MRSWVRFKTCAQDSLIGYKSLAPETALDLARAALADCQKRGYQVAVAVVDRFGVVQVVLRDRYAGPHTPATASGKAWTAATFRNSTSSLFAISQPGMMQAGIRNLPGAVIIGGGLMVETGGSLVGAIGVSGAPWKTMTFLAALRCDRIEAPWFLEGPIDGDSFRLYVEKVLLPSLRPGDIVIMDNLGSHRSKVVRQLIRAAGAKLFFLPKYSLDLNPIEQVFAKLKHFLRQAAARTVEAVCVAIGGILQAFTPEECANYFTNSGYGRT